MPLVKTSGDQVVQLSMNGNSRMCCACPPSMVARSLRASINLSYTSVALSSLRQVFPATQKFSSFVHRNPHLSTALHSKLKTPLLSKSYPDSYSSPYLPPVSTPNTIHQSCLTVCLTRWILTLCLLILFRLSACE